MKFNFVRPFFSAILAAGVSGLIVVGHVAITLAVADFQAADKGIIETIFSGFSMFLGGALIMVPVALVVSIPVWLIGSGLYWLSTRYSFARHSLTWAAAGANFAAILAVALGIFPPASPETSTLLYAFTLPVAGAAGALAFKHTMPPVG